MITATSMFRFFAAFRAISQLDLRDLKLQQPLYLVQRNQSSKGNLGVQIFVIFVIPLKLCPLLLILLETLRYLQTYREINGKKCTNPEKFAARV